MTTGSDRHRREQEPVFTNMRGVRYGEVLAVHQRDGGLEAEVFGTQMLNDCPAELWDTLRPEEIARELGALAVKLNGPRYWVIDGIGTKVAVVDPLLRDFNGLTMRRIAVVQLGDQPSNKPYTERKVNRGAVFFYDPGEPVHELLAPDGTTYVMQAYCTGVDPGLTEDQLPSLSRRLALPRGWSYRTRVLEDRLVVDTSHSLATVVQDELENTYTLPY